MDRLNLHRLRHSLLVKNTLWSLLGFGSRLGIQALYFVIIARKLGVENYGAFVGVVAIATLFAPFSAWGSHFILVKHVARDKSTFPRYFGTALGTCIVSGLALVLITAILSILVFSRTVSVWVPLLICFSDLLLSRLVDVAGSAFQAFERLKMMAFIQGSSSAIRLAAAIALLLLFPTPASAVTWALLYAISSGAAALLALSLVRIKLGWGPLSLRLARSQFREGFHFAVSVAAQGAYNDVDKSMVGRMDSFAAAGFYSAAYRIQDAVYSPFRALLQASYARFFREGRSGIGGSAAFAKRLLPWALSYSFAAAAFLFLISPVLPMILGPGYQDTAVALRWIALLPVLRTASYMAASILTGADRQPVRSTIQTGIAVMNFSLNLVLIPRFGWVAAAWTSLASDGVCAVALWTAVMVITARINRTANEEQGVRIARGRVDR